jgi:hypothetical protein
MNDLPESEFDAYIGGVYGLLASGATARQVAEHLRRLEVKEMGLTSASADHLLPVAEMLLSLNVRLN